MENQNIVKKCRKRTEPEKKFVSYFQSSDASEVILGCTRETVNISRILTFTHSIVKTCYNAVLSLGFHSCKKKVFSIVSQKKEQKQLGRLHKKYTVKHSVCLASIKKKKRKKNVLTISNNTLSANGYLMLLRKAYGWHMKPDKIKLEIKDLLSNDSD